MAACAISDRRVAMRGAVCRLYPLLPAVSPLLAGAADANRHVRQILQSSGRPHLIPTHASAGEERLSTISARVDRGGRALPIPSSRRRSPAIWADE